MNHIMMCRLEKKQSAVLTSLKKSEVVSIQKSSKFPPHTIEQDGQHFQFRYLKLYLWAFSVFFHNNQRKQIDI